MGMGLASGKAWVRIWGCVLRQEKLGKGGRDVGKQIGNLSLEPCGCAIPSGRAGPAAGSESCVAAGQPALRSVDSQCRSCAIEPRNYQLVGSLRGDVTRGPSRRTAMAWCGGPTGVEEHGEYTSGFSRNLRGPTVSTGIPGRSYRANNSRPATGTLGGGGSDPGRHGQLTCSRHFLLELRLPGGYTG